MHLIISCSMNKLSKSRMMARHAYDLYSRDAKFLDLQDFELPICDGNTCYEDLAVKKLKEIISNAKSIILASPIYNYDFNAAAKNLIELTGRSWNEKIVGFLSSAGGMNSFMSPISFANIMMIDFRCIIIPRYVYADKKCFSENDEINNEIKERIEKLVEKSIFLTNSLL